MIVAHTHRTTRTHESRVGECADLQRSALGKYGMRAAPPHSLLFCFACHPDWTTTRRTVTTNQHPHHLRRFTTISFSFIVCNSQFPPVHNATPPLHQKPWSVNNTATRAGGRLSGKGRVVRPRPLSVFFFCLNRRDRINFWTAAQTASPFHPLPRQQQSHMRIHTHARPWHTISVLCTSIPTT